MTLVKQLEALGVGQGSIVMVHASMRAVGGRAEDVVRALLEAVGPGGTVSAYVDFEAVDDVRGFDLARSPAARDHGVFAEVLRRWPGAVRSHNPGASMAAVGARAAWLCAEHPMNYGYGPGTPLGRIVEAGGAVLLLGSHFDHVTLLHYAEHVARIEGKRVVRYTVEADGVERTIEEFDTSEGVVDAMPERYFERVVQAFVNEHTVSSGLVGSAQSYLLDARALAAFAADRMERDFG